MEDSKRDYYHRLEGGPRNYHRWTRQEIDLILNHPLPDREIARHLGRGVMAVQCKRWRERCRQGIW